MAGPASGQRLFAGQPLLPGQKLAPGQTLTGDTFGKFRKLSNAREFDRVFSQNQHRISTSGLLLMAVENDLGYSRLGMVIGKKALVRAPHRNALKRHLREYFRQAPLPAVDIVILARPGIRNTPLSQWHQLIDQSFSRLLSKLS